MIRWADSTASAYRAEAGQLDRQRQAAVALAGQHRAAREAAEGRTAAAESARQSAQLVARTVRARLDSVRTAADSLPVLVDLVASQDSVIEGYRVESTSLREALTAEVQRSAELTRALTVADSAMGRAAHRIAVLDSLVRAKPPVSRETFFGLRFPSRTVSLAAGVLLGLVIR